MPPQVEMDICRLYRAGWKVAALMAHFGIRSTGTIPRMLTRRGVERRVIGRPRSSTHPRAEYWRKHYRKRQGGANEET